MSDLLAELRAEGRLDSEGRFSIDLYRARERLGAYQLPDPSCYVLKALQAAVASGATRVDVHVRGRELTLEHDGEAPLPSALDRLESYLLTEGPAPLRHAAAAVYGGLARRVGEVELETRGDEGVSLRVWTGDHREQGHTRPLPGWWSVRWTFRRRGFVLRFWVAELVRLFLGRGLPEEDALWRYGLYCPARLRLNWRDVVRPEAGSSFNPNAMIDTTSYVGADLARRDGGAEGLLPAGFHLAERSVLADRWGPGTFAAPVLPPSKLYRDLEGRLHELPVEARFVPALVHEQVGAAPPPRCDAPGDGPEGCVPCAALLALDASLQGPGRLVLVRHGVVLDTREVDLGCPGARAIACADALREDLSRFSVVEDEAYEELLRTLRQHVAEMIEVARYHLGWMLDARVEQWVLERLPVSPSAAGTAAPSAPTSGAPRPARGRRTRPREGGRRRGS